MYYFFPYDDSPYFERAPSSNRKEFISYVIAAFVELKLRLVAAPRLAFLYPSVRFGGAGRVHEDNHCRHKYRTRAAIYLEAGIAGLINENEHDGLGFLGCPAPRWRYAP